MLWNSFALQGHKITKTPILQIVFLKHVYILNEQHTYKETDVIRLDQNTGDVCKYLITHASCALVQREKAHDSITTAHVNIVGYQFFYMQTNPYAHAFSPPRLNGDIRFIQRCFGGLLDLRRMASKNSSLFTWDCPTEV